MAVGPPPVTDPPTPICTTPMLAGLFASVEWIRRKVARLDYSTEPYAVLSVLSPSPEFDLRVARLLRVRRPNLSYVVVSDSELFANLGRDAASADLADVITVIRSKLGAWDGSVPSSVRESGELKYDLGLCPTFRSCTGLVAPEAEVSLARRVGNLVREDGGILVVMRWGTEGAHDLRQRLKGVVFAAEGSEGAETSESSGPEQALKISESGVGYAWAERADAQVDVTAAAGEELNADGAQLVRDLLGVDPGVMLERYPVAIEHAVDEMVESSLEGDGFDGARVVVWSPLHVVVVQVGAGGSDTVGEDGVSEPTPIPTTACTRAVPELLSSNSAAFGAEGWAVVRSSHPSTADLSSHPDAAEVAEHWRLDGPWGSLQGRGDGMAVRAYRAEADRQYSLARPDDDDRLQEEALVQIAHKLGEPAKEALIRAGPAQILAAGDLLRTFDPWFPQGRHHGFFNLGRQYWTEIRRVWTAVPPGFSPPRAPPPVDTDIVTEELARLQRTYTLPGPMRLSDVVDILVDLWQEDFGY